MAIAVGVTVTDGPYTYNIDHLISDTGGFGVVFHGVRTAPDALEVAVKTPKPHADPVWAQKFEREARILNNVAHPNVVRMLHFWKFADGTMAIVQEFIPGARTLDKAFADPSVDRCSVALQALFGLRAIHGDPIVGSVIHRDLSPNNILVDGYGLVRIIDFGLAKEDPRKTKILTKLGTIFGTEGCIAPEQWNDVSGVDSRADIFALGKSITAALQNRTPVYAQPHLLPEPWLSLCEKMTAHDVMQRHASVDQVLTQIFTSFPAAQVSVTDLARVAEEMRRIGYLPGWGAFAGAWFTSRLPSLSDDDMRTVFALDRHTLVDPAFPADALFSALNVGPIESTYGSGNASFSFCDPLGEYLARTYTGLSPENRLKAFRRLVRVACDYNRYPVMAQVRAAYAQEKDPALAQQLLEILNAEDPYAVIHGWSVIPGRP